MADERIPELVSDIEAVMTACLLSELLIEKPRAAEISKKVAKRILDDWGGQQIYIPKNSGQLVARDFKIWEDFNGKNHLELAKKHDLTPQQIYRIIREVSERERAKSQADLFET